MSVSIDKETIQKYDIAGPRYTSYPTAPVWSNQLTEQQYIEKLKNFGQTDKTLSLYIHIPFCQSMCSFCACNVIIRQLDPKYGDEYLNYLFREAEKVAGYIGRKAAVKQFHLGGGTPTFLNSDQLTQLYQKMEKLFDIDPEGEIAIEIDPRTIDEDKMKTLRSLGFNRVSMGIQDFEEKVQESVNRIQPIEKVKAFNNWCREMGFQSINFDLIYGLPHQTIQTFQNTVEEVIRLKPDRIALYSFAYLPWMKKHQTKIEDDHLPSNDDKLSIFLNARQQFLESGYQAIAMDHFALITDEMAKAYNDQRLYRNFMGYTVKPADEYIGLGVSSIGFVENTFVQNHKVLPEYYRQLDAGHLPVERGKILNEDDRIRQWTISSLMCHFEIDKARFTSQFHLAFDEYFKDEQEHIKHCIEDGLLTNQPNRLVVTELGRIFIRNICMGFDFYLRQKGAHTRFSKTV
ncbi:MAG: oxygen-independent coproporphyrinogen III oxidase [Candidatus Omnitrophica bacterium]|nr:oxygen-independent coproporphyrinogen III oxidase [Candidatus Omnitrophota bacterium]